MNFNYDPFQENIAILGLQGSGKTTLAKRILNILPTVPRWIWSPQRPDFNYSGYGRPVNNWKDMTRGAYIWTGEYSQANFDRFCNEAMKFANMIIVVDDVQEFQTKQKIPAPFARLINGGRNRGICGIYLSPSPNLVNNTVLQSCQHIYAFKFNLAAQIEWVERNYFGPDAWILLPKHLRQKQPAISDLEVLPDHSYLYRKHTDTSNSLVLP